MLSYLHYEEIWRKFGKGLAIFVNIWYYGDRKIEGMEVQAYMKKFTKKFFEVHLLNGGGLVPTGTLSSGATILIGIDYNIKSTGVL